MAQVVATHDTCSSNQAALAFSEKPSLPGFSPAIGSILEPGKFPKTEAFFEGVRRDAAAATAAAKQYWKRPRPYTVEPSLASGKPEKSFGYPSGHSTEAMVLALVLADLLPEQREEVLAIGRNIGWHRVWIARHYPTDIYAGRVFAQAILRELKASTEFQRDLAEARAEIEAGASIGTRLQNSATFQIDARPALRLRDFGPFRRAGRPGFWLREQCLQLRPREVTPESFQSNRRSTGCGGKRRRNPKLQVPRSKGEPCDLSQRG